MAAGAIGEMIVPVIIGTLIDKLGPKSFLYVICTAVLALVVVFIIMQCFAGKHGMRDVKPSEPEKSGLHETDV